MINVDDLILGELLGRGSFGSVRKATHNGREVAVKIVRGSLDHGINSREPMYMSMVAGNEHFPILYGIGLGNKSTYLVMEFLEGGSLYHLLHVEKNYTYTYPQALRWITQAAKGLAHLHSLGSNCVIHRDVKSPNMLLDRDRVNLKICDFGFVRQAATEMTENRGTALYMAPEVFNGQRYTDKCDVFSLGITMGEVLTRQVPYHNEPIRNTVSLFEKVDEGLRPSLDNLIFECPDHIKTLITRCWAALPEDRPTMQQVVDELSRE